MRWTSDCASPVTVEAVAMDPLDKIEQVDPDCGTAFRQVFGRWPAQYDPVPAAPPFYNTHHVSPPLSSMLKRVERMSEPTCWYIVCIMDIIAVLIGQFFVLVGVRCRRR